MMQGSENIFEFKIDHPEKPVFQVLDYEAREEMSELYEYRIRVLSFSANLDPLDLMKYRGHFTIHFDKGKKFVMHGNVEGMRFVKGWQVSSAAAPVPNQTHAKTTTHGQTQTKDHHKSSAAANAPDLKYEYEFILVPAVSSLDRHKRTRVYLNKSLKDIIQQILKEHHIATDQYRLDLMAGEYKNYEFIFQYRETDLNFLRYWFERFGLYFYFEQPVDKPSEVLVITDKNNTHKGSTLAPALSFRESASLSDIFGKSEVSQWSDLNIQIPSKMLIRGYNYEKAGTPIHVETEIQNAKTGVVNIFDELIWTDQHAKDYGKIWKEAYLAEQTRNYATSYGMILVPGQVTALSGHYCSRFNQRFLITASNHQGSVRKPYLMSRLDVSSLPDAPLFQCDFECISIAVQYRDPVETALARVYGLLQATVDSSSTAGVADIDSYGRYKISFMQEEKPDGAAGKHSCRVRKQEYYVGNKFGVHHPLSPGVEVLVGFVNGNPNCPMITGAVFNSQNMNIVSGDCAHENRYVSGSGQKNVTNQKDGFTATTDGNGGAMIALGNTKKARSSYWSPPSMVGNPFD